MRLFSTDPSEPGVFAVGQEAVGIFALGQLSLGVVAVGQLARGVVAVGQLAVGVVAVGQGAVGLWWAAGMLGFGGWDARGLIAVGGRYARGLLPLPLLPGWMDEKPAPRPPETPASDILSGQVSEGWVRATIRSEFGKPSVHADAEIDVTALAADLTRALGSGQQEALVRAHGVVDDEQGYRAAASRRLVGDQLIAWPTRPPRFLTYGAGRASATRSRIVWRSTLYLLLVGAWVAVAVPTVLGLVSP